MLSPRSRGKGSRRVPWRDGGRRKTKSVSWRKQAQHALDSVDDFVGPVHLLMIHGYYGDSASDMIYRFDQAMAKIGVHYYAEFSGQRQALWRWTFKVWVLAAKVAEVQEIISRIKRK